MKIFVIAILGAGASGLFSAGLLGKTNKIIIDASLKPGRKLLASGGGLCNFSNENMGAEFYFSQNPHFIKSALAGFKTQDFLDILDKNNITYDLRSSKQYFAKSSKDILSKFDFKEYNVPKNDFVGKKRYDLKKKFKY